MTVINGPRVLDVLGLKHFPDWSVLIAPFHISIGIKESIMANAFIYHVARCKALAVKPLTYTAFIKLLNKLETP